MSAALVTITEVHPTTELRAQASDLGITAGMRRMFLLLDTLDAGSCTARPWRSCSRPDGQPLRHWARKPWTNYGASCAGPS